MDQNQYGQHARGTGAPGREARGMRQNQMSTGYFAASSYPREQLYAPQNIHQLQQEPLQQQLNNFWEKQYQEIEEITEFRSHSLPLARIKKIMKSDEDVRMISAEAPVVFAKACEMFILELTTRAWHNAEENKRRTLQKNDIASAISRSDMYDFLVDVVPRDDTVQQHEVFAGIPRTGSGVAPTENVPDYYVPTHQHVAGAGLSGAPRMAMGRPMFDQAHPFPHQMWPTPKEEHSSNLDD